MSLHERPRHVCPYCLKWFDTSQGVEAHQLAKRHRVGDRQEGGNLERRMRAYDHARRKQIKAAKAALVAAGSSGKGGAPTGPAAAAAGSLPPVRAQGAALPPKSSTAVRGFARGYENPEDAARKFAGLIADALIVALAPAESSPKPLRPDLAIGALQVAMGTTTDPEVKPWLQTALDFLTGDYEPLDEDTAEARSEQAEGEA